VAGLRIVWNPLAAPLSRLRGLLVRATDGSYAPLDPDRRYRVATTNFLRTGGDGYAMLRDNAINPYDTGPPLDDAVSRAIAAGVSPDIDGRIVLR